VRPPVAVPWSPDRAWSGPCDVIIRRHPKSGYLVDIIGSGLHAIHAHAILGMAQHYAAEANPPKDPLTDTPLTLDQASRAVHVMRAANILVDDKALVVDARMSQWGKVLGFLIFPGGLVAAFLTERNPEASSWVASGFLFLLGLLIGGWLYREYERDGARIASSLDLARRGALVVLGFVALYLCLVATVDLPEARRMGRDVDPCGLSCRVRLHGRSRGVEAPSKGEGRGAGEQVAADEGRPNPTQESLSLYADRAATIGGWSVEDHSSPLLTLGTAGAILLH
jgi:hypothetical protein